VFVPSRYLSVYETLEAFVAFLWDLTSIIVQRIGRFGKESLPTVLMEDHKEKRMETKRTVSASTCTVDKRLGPKQQGKMKNRVRWKKDVKQGPTRGLSKVMHNKRFRNEGAALDGVCRRAD